MLLQIFFIVQIASNFGLYIFLFYTLPIITQGKTKCILLSLLQEIKLIRP